MASFGTRYNIFDIRDYVSGSSLLSMHMTESLYVQINYGGSQLITYGPGVLSQASLGWADITIQVTPSGVTAISNVDNYLHSGVPSSYVNTAGRTYNFFASNAALNSAGGSLQSLLVTGIKMCPILRSSLVYTHVMLHCIAYNV